MKKVLILSASPHRDKYLDNLIADELKKLDCEVMVKPCLREGRDAVLTFKPDVVVTPPIRNPYARDFAQQCKDFGCAVISRHTEASCDWQDFKKMDEKTKADILGAYRYNIDAELCWGKDEAEILNRRNTKFKAVSVGCLAADVYKQANFKERFINRSNFCKKYGFDEGKKILLITSPWGFSDSAPDLSIDEMVKAKNDRECKARHLDMIRKIKPLLEDWNILISLHPGLGTEDYKKVADELKIPIDTESSATDLLANADCLIHGGSTMAMEMHWQDKPAFQFQDVNAVWGWWLNAESPLSKISPMMTTPEQLAEAIRQADKSNANIETLAILEAGRYGCMDGKATQRAAEIINSYSGKFELKWPRAAFDYDQLLYFKESEKVALERMCGICKNKFYQINPQWINALAMNLKLNPEQQKAIAEGYKATLCPNCAARFIAQ